MKPRKTNAPEIWGLTGGVASGKSTVARLFAEAGIPVLDADALARELSSPGGLAFDAIVARFGTADRAELRRMIFSDNGARKDLEAILHPLIRAESARRIAALAKAGAKAVIYEAALLVETGRHRDMTGLIVIEANEDARRTRLMARDGISESLARGMMESQTDDEARRAAATEIWVNNGGAEELRARVTVFVGKRGWG